jgi:hypothetical protein
MPMRLRPLPLAVAGVTGLVCSGIALASGTTGDREGRGTHHADRVAPEPGLRVSARVRGRLYPGVRRPLLVTIGNRHRRVVTVTSVRVRVRRAPRGCPRRTVRLSRFAGRVRVPPRRRRVLRLRARMVPRAANACQGARFALRAWARAGGGRR